MIYFTSNITFVNAQGKTVTVLKKLQILQCNIFYKLLFLLNQFRVNILISILDIFTLL